MARAQTLIVAGALAICLIAGSPPRLVGDGREYLAQAIEFASFHGPAFRPADIPHIQAELAQFDPVLANWDIWSSTIGDANRGRAFLHFWFYSLLAAPGIWLTHSVGASPTFAFTGLNLLLLGIAVWVVFPRVGLAACVLLFAGPIIWWIDKAHTEVFTFALLIVTLALMRDRPWWSMIAAGMAATQNPPIAILVPIVFALAVLRDRAALRDARVLAGAAAGLALALLHPIYTYTHYGRLSLLLEQTRGGVPTFQALSAVVLDPSVGLIGNYPLFLIVVAAGLLVLVRHHRADAISTEVIVSTIAAAIFLFSFSRTTNVHHGGTPSISRYALWLIPLAIPILSALHRNGGAPWRRLLWSAATLSALISVFAFHPAVPQNSREPTRLAAFLWSRFPSWNNPLPEVFIETQLHIDEPRVPVATPGCEKILVAGSDVSGSGWPTPCYPAPLPSACQTAGALCYANFTGRDYEFKPVQDVTITAAAIREDDAWPVSAIPHVRKLYDAWNWRSMHAGPLSVVRGADHVSVESLGANDHFILVLRDPGEGAVIRLRSTERLNGILTDPASGQALRSVEYDPQSGLLTIDLPHHSRLLLLAMRTDDSR